MAKKKKASKKTPYQAPKDFPHGAIAIQALARQLEVYALSAYATDQAKFKAISIKIGKLVELFRPKGGVGDMCKRPCPPGYYCCCGNCLPHGYNCHLCEGKNKTFC